MLNVLYLYEVLLGIEESLDYQDEVIDVVFIQQYNKVINDIIECTKDDYINRYKIEQKMINTYSYCFTGCLKKEIIMFLKPMKRYIERKYIPKKIDDTQINNLYESLNNKELKGFSEEDILSAGLAAYDVELGEDEYFVMGDNCNNSEDSRVSNIGNIKRSQFVGKIAGTLHKVTRQ